MREILFRGKRIDNGDWIIGFLMIADERYFILSESAMQFHTPDFLKAGVYMVSGFVEVEPVTVGQYTGLKDENGKRIFEGDICKITVDGISVEKDMFEIRWDKTNLELQAWSDKEGLGLGYVRVVEVIGNIYDNQELLEA